MKEHAKKLIEVHNALLDIKTSGQDSFVMVECIKTIRSVISEIKPEEEENVIHQD